MREKYRLRLIEAWDEIGSRYVLGIQQIDYQKNLSVYESISEPPPKKKGKLTVRKLPYTLGKINFSTI